MNLDEFTIRELIDCLQWYVETDETYEGGIWEEENAFWLEGKRKAMALLERIKKENARPDVTQLLKALELISDTDPDEGTAWFHEVANKALAAYCKQEEE